MTGKWGPGSPDAGSESESNESSAADWGDEEEEIDEEASESESEGETIPDEVESEEFEEQIREDCLNVEKDVRRQGSSEDLLESGEYEFLPVFGFNEGHMAVRRFRERQGEEVEEPTDIAGQELSWWEDESIMPKHPYMLINPVGFTTADADREDFRVVFRYDKGNQFVFSDSGGYQLMSMDEAEIVDSVDEHEFQDYRVYPERLVEWQVMHADAGATIDFPPYNISGDSSFPDAVEHNDEWKDFYDMRRKKSADMAGRMASHLEEMRDQGIEGARDYAFAPVIHGKPNPDGKTHKYLSRWHGSIVKELDFWPRGWTLKPEPSHNFGQIALHLGYGAEHLTDRSEYLHVLMVGGMLQKALIMYFAMRSDVFVTSDASSYAAGGMRRQFDLPSTAGRRSVIISNRSDDEREDTSTDATRLDRYPCRCQVCSTVEREEGFEFITEGTGSARNATMNLHNLNLALNVERTIDALLREEDEDIVKPGGEPTGSEFWRFISGLASEKKVEDLYRAMAYVRVAQEEGLDEANRRFRILWETSSGRTILPASGSAAEW